VLVVRWVDRFGRNYADVTEVIRQFMARGVVVKTVINKMTFDGATRGPHAEGRQRRADRLHGRHSRGRRQRPPERPRGPV
jgi:Resolvase, N terminal domain